MDQLLRMQFLQNVPVKKLCSKLSQKLAIFLGKMWIFIYSKIGFRNRIAYFDGKCKKKLILEFFMQFRYCESAIVMERITKRSKNLQILQVTFLRFQ